MNQSLHGLAREVHVGLRLGEDELFLFVARVHDDGLRLQLHPARVQTHGDAVNQHEAKIVTVIAVFAAGVAQADEKEDVLGHE
jgi:hypothetical protein